MSHWATGALWRWKQMQLAAQSMRTRLDSDWKGCCQGWITQEFTNFFCGSFYWLSVKPHHSWLFFIFITVPNIFSKNQYYPLNFCEPTLIAQYPHSSSCAGPLNKTEEQQEQLSATRAVCADPEQPLLCKAPMCSHQHKCVCTVLPLTPSQVNSGG